MVLFETARSMGEPWSTLRPSMVTEDKSSRSELDRCLLSSSTIRRAKGHPRHRFVDRRVLPQPNLYTCRDGRTGGGVGPSLVDSNPKRASCRLGRCGPSPLAGMILASICSSLRVPDTWTGGVAVLKLFWNSRARPLIVRRIPSTSLLYRRSPSGSALRSRSELGFQASWAAGSDRCSASSESRWLTKTPAKLPPALPPVSRYWTTIWGPLRIRATVFLKFVSFPGSSWTSGAVRRQRLQGPMSSLLTTLSIHATPTLVVRRGDVAVFDQAVTAQEGRQLWSRKGLWWGEDFIVAAPQLDL